MLTGGAGGLEEMVVADLAVRPIRRGGQRLDRQGAVVDLNVGVDAQGQADVAMAGQGLRHFGRDAGPLQIRDEQMPHAVEIGK